MFAAAGAAHLEACVEMLAGCAALPRSGSVAATTQLDELGEKALLATTAAMLAQAIYAQGRHDEAAEYLPP